MESGADVCQEQIHVRTLQRLAVCPRVLQNKSHSTLKSCHSFHFRFLRREMNMVQALSRQEDWVVGGLLQLASSSSCETQPASSGSRRPYVDNCQRWRTRI